MTTWTDDELRELVALWPINSAKQIAARMHRPRSAICSKAKRLRAEGVLPHDAKHTEINPRPPRRHLHRIKPPKPPSPPDSLEMGPCSILELNAKRCHWPLGNVNDVATLFCGGAPVPHCPYCAHHLRMARGPDRERGRDTRY